MAVKFGVGIKQPDPEFTTNGRVDEQKIRDYITTKYGPATQDDGTYKVPTTIKVPPGTSRLIFQSSVPPLKAPSTTQPAK
jgi:hypothetical protein